MAIGDLNVRIGATIKGLQAGLKSAERELKTFARQTNNLGNSLTLGLSLPLAGIGAAAVQAFAQFEGLKNGLTAIAGSAEAAEEQLTRLRKIALQPSVNLEQAVNASIQLQTVGFQAEEAERAISQFAKAATLSNAGAEGLAAVVKQITQINSKGRILQEDIGRILENVPSVGIALKDAFGTTSVEAIRASGISAREFTDRLIGAIEASETFQAAQGGLATQIENFGIGLKESGVALGEAIAKSINLGGTLEKLTGIINKVVDGFKSLTPEQQKAIVQIGLLVLSIGPAIKVISLLASGITALLSPINLVIVAVVALASAFIYAYNTNEQFRGGVLGSVAAIGEVITIFKEAAQALANGFKQIGEGDFSGAVASFGEFLKKGNPIGLAVTEGERLAKAYKDGFAKAATAGKLPTVSEFISNVTGGAKPAALDLSGATGKKEKQTLDQDFFDKSVETPVIPTLAKTDALEGVARITEELRAQFSTIPPEIIAGDQSLQGFLDRLNNELAPAVAVAAEAVPSASAVFEELAVQFENVDQKTALFGNSADALSQKLALTKQAIEAVLEDGGNTIAIELLTDQYKTLETQLSLVNEELQDMIDRGKKVSALSALSDVFSAMSVEILRLAKAGETSFARLGAAALAAAAKVVRAKLVEAVVAYAADAFQKLGIFGVFLAGAAGAVVGAVFTSLLQSVGVPAFAQGGIVTGPTIGLVGEAGPEAIIPLRKLGDVTGMGNMELVTRVSGDDLYLIMQRANTRKNRIG
jgi:tape measure domain-containing protein